MNEQTTTQDRLAEEIDVLLSPYLDPMSRNDFRIACHHQDGENERTVEAPADPFEEE